MTDMLWMLMAAAAVPVAAAAASRAALPRLAARGRGLPRRNSLCVVALAALVATLVVAHNPATAAEGDMHTFSGTITDSDGTALAGMNVSVFCTDCPDGSSSDPSANAARPWPGSRWGSGARLLGEVATDASGAWSVTVTEPSSGYPAVVAWDPDGDYGLASVTSSWQWESRTGLDTQLADGGRLSGRIRADGSSAPAAGFILQGVQGPETDNLLWGGISLLVGADGRYRTPGLPDGRYSLSYPGDLAEPYVAYASVWLGAISGGADSTANHSLLEYASVSGRVTDANGRALGGIQVVASPVGVSAAGSLVASPVGAIGRGEAETAADGTYSIDTVAPGGRFVIEFHSDDDEHVSEYYNDRAGFGVADSVEIRPGGVSGIDAQLAPGARVSGHLRDADGQPLTDRWMSLCAENYSCHYEESDDSGRFEFGGLAAGLYTLRGAGHERCVAVAEGRHVRADLQPRGDGEGYVDVPEGAYYTEAVTSLDGLGLFAGTEWGEGFCPGAAIDRKTMAVWTVRVLDGKDPEPVTETGFNDVSSWSFHAPFVERMADLKVTTGCGDDKFCPDNNVTRAQMAVFLSRALKLPDGPDAGFSDVAADAWYAVEVDKLAQSRITQGCGDGKFCPDDDVTRAQMAVFLARAVELDLIGIPTRTFKAVTAGFEHSCALDTDGAITCWGNNWYGQTDAPTGQFKAVTAGGSSTTGHTCALDTDGAITCWGDNSGGQTDAPSGQFKAVTAGGVHSCGLRDNGTITCWGNNRDGQTDAPSGQFKAVTAGGVHSCGLRDNGTITCWGNNRDGQTDAPSGQFKAVTAGGVHSCGLRDNGTITCWSDNDHGESDAPTGTFKAVTVGSAHSCGLRDDNTITCWGWNRYGGQTDAPSGQFKAVTAGAWHNCALRDDDTITCWGWNRSGQADEWSPFRGR